MKKPYINVAVLGGGGYIGMELLQRLSQHPHVRLVFFSSETYANEYPGFIFPPLRNSEIFRKIPYRKLRELPQVDLVFSALPSGVLPEILPEIQNKTHYLINLAGDFRLDNLDEIRKYYPKTCAITSSVETKYVVPEFDQGFSTKIINMPGCMAVAAIYALYPLAKDKLIGSEIIIDAKTGSTGGGVKEGDAHAIRANNVKTYKLFGHRHAPEIRNYLDKLAPELKNVHMTITSLDLARGVLIHAYGKLKQQMDEVHLLKLYLKTYKDCKFIRFLSVRKGRERLPSVKSNIGTNFCDVFITTDWQSDFFIATASLDNLVKGGAGNAIQMMNQLYGFELNYGLQGFGVWP